MCSREYTEFRVEKASKGHRDQQARCMFKEKHGIKEQASTLFLKKEQFI